MSIWTKRPKEFEAESGAGFLLPPGFLEPPGFLVGGEGNIIWFKRTKEEDTE